MTTTLARKAWVDLRRHRARSVLAVVTIAAAVATTGISAVPVLIDRTVDRQISSAHLYDVRLRVNDVALTADQLEAMTQLPNVSAFNARVAFPTRISVGDRRESAMAVGVDFDHQDVNTVEIVDGVIPGRGEIVADSRNAQRADFELREGQSANLLAAGGQTFPLEVSGTGSTLAFNRLGSQAGTADIIVYGRNDTIRDLAGLQGYNLLEFTLADTSTAAAKGTIEAVRQYLADNTSTTGFSELPNIRAPGDWPGKAQVEVVAKVFYIFGFLAFACGLFLISNTMRTLVAEQSNEIGIMKALGGRRSQIAGVYIRSAAILGGIGVLIGVPLGALLAFGLARLLASNFLGMNVGFGVNVPTMIIGAALGVLVSIAATFPALHKGLHVSVRDALEDKGLGSPFGGGLLDRIVLHSRWLPPLTRAGVRNVARRKRRNAATIAQIAVGVAATLALLGASYSVSNAVNGIYRDLRWDIEVHVPAGVPASTAIDLARGPDVADVDVLYRLNIEHDDNHYTALGIGADPSFDYKMNAGHWFTPDEQSGDSGSVVVLGYNAARAMKAHAGDVIQLTTGGEPVAVRVVGVDSTFYNNGLTVFVPLPTLQKLSSAGDSVNRVWVTTTAHDRNTVDRAAAGVQDRLNAAGYASTPQTKLTLSAGDAETNAGVFNTLRILGFIVVFISMVGLISVVIMSIVERQREIGVLRCLGARARHIRHIFTVESLVLAVAGGTVGVPLGWLTFQGLMTFASDALDFEIPRLFPASILVVPLLATILLCLVIIRPSLRRATRLLPGDALRYQ